MATDSVRPGTVVELEIGPVAHGGHCVARHDGRVVFVRHTLPGERVRARLTDAAPDAKFWRADAVDVLDASPDRVEHAWPDAGPGGVGGAELAHVALPAQRAWKAAVLAEQLRRLARLDLAPEVEAAPGDDARGGLGWRTRIELHVDAEGRAGMRRHRSHTVVPLTAMPLATEHVAALGLFDRRWPAGSRLGAVAPADGSTPVVLLDGQPFDLHANRPDARSNARASVRESVVVGDVTSTYRVSAAGFWQVHREAPALLAARVLEAVGDVTGATVLDLYSGAGLFSTPLAAAVGPQGRLVAVEGDEQAVRDARRNAHGLPQVELHAGDVLDVLTGRRGSAPPTAAADVVVLDPPRTGAGRRVLDAVASLAPRRIVYVACDPAALARDVALLGERGWSHVTVRGYDLFPMTHHVEAVAVLDR